MELPEKQTYFRTIDIAAGVRKEKVLRVLRSMSNDRKEATMRNTTVSMHANSQHRTTIMFLRGFL